MTRRSCMWLFVVLALLCSPTVFAAQGITVKAVKGFNTVFDVAVPAPTVESMEVLGRPAVSVTLPGGSLSFDKGAPALPRLTAMVLVDPTRAPTLRLEKGQPEIIQLEAPVAPSKGNFTRDIDPANVPYVYGEAYSQDAWIPADKDLVAITEPFILRELRGVRLMVQPVQYNPVKNQLRVYRQMTIGLNGTTADSRNSLPGKIAISPVYEAIYRNTFLNFAQTTSRLPRLEENGRLLIVTADAFADALTPFVAWKMKNGLQVKVLKVSEIASPITTDAIKAAIQKEYDLGGLTHIMLVGDAENVPTPKGVKENADSDPCYTKLAGNDHIPDAIISRISATTPETVSYQLAKSINYEQFPMTGANGAWYRKGVGIASAEGKPTDYERAGWLRKALLAKFTSVDEIYDPKASKAAVSASVNDGRSLINYIGHGSATSWGTTYFNNTDCAALTNGLKMPIIWSVACVNGQFVGKTCFAEAWMRAGTVEKPAGAAAIFAASTNQEWVPPCDVQSEINNVYTVNETYKTVGGLAFNGIMKGLEIYGTEPKGSGVMMFEQWHLFGDGTMRVRFADPKPITTTSVFKTAENGNTLTFAVVDAEGKPVADARVTVYTPKYETVLVATSNEQGQAVVKLPASFGTEGYATITGNNLVPVVDQKLTF